MKIDKEHPGKTTQLALRLSLAQTCGEAIEEIVRVYELTGNLDSVAIHFEIGKRTLERWIAKTPELAKRIAAIRKGQATE
jgi:hypothetical protein